MAAASFQASPLDRLTIVQKIRDVFDRSPLFREAQISDPLPRPDGGVSMDVRFGSAPALFCIVAPSPERAYAILYELAVSLVDIERAHAEGSLDRGEGGCNGTVGGIPPAGEWTA
jgi:hypothetical protein